MLNLFGSRHSERSSKSRALAPSPNRVECATNTPTQAGELLRRFNPRLVGFGIVDPRGASSLASEAAGSPGHYLRCKGPEERV